MKNTTSLLVIIFAVALSGCVGPKSAEKESARQKINEGALVIDVRSPKAYQANHLTGATNIPLENISKHCSELGDLNRPIVVYCNAGIMAGQAKQQLEKFGFTDVSNAGGLADVQK
jgi:phage shock protein E